jgi:hypothetical protein
MTDMHAPELSQIGVPMPAQQPLYIFALTALIGERKVVASDKAGSELPFADTLVESVGDTLMALGFAGAETWIVSDRGVADAGRTADWLAQRGLRSDQLYLGYRWGTDMGLDAEDMGRLRAVFERRGLEDRWPGMVVYSVGDGPAVLPGGKPIFLGN